MLQLQAGSLMELLFMVLHDEDRSASGHVEQSSPCSGLVPDLSSWYICAAGVHGKWLVSSASRCSALVLFSSSFLTLSWMSAVVVAVVV